MVQNHQGGYNSNSRKLQKKKAPLLRRLIHLGMLVVALLTAFFMGKSVGQITAKEQILEVVQASVSKQEYGAGNEKLLELLIGETKVKEDVNSFTESSKPEVEGNVGAEEVLDKQERTPEKDHVRLALLWEEYPEWILVNKEYKLPEDYEVELKKLPDGTNRADELSYDAFDIVALDYQMLDAKQEKTEENKWLRNHCAEYGFILRYPKEKEDITQISYESWHFRYVGKDAAEYIMEKEITLEEYLEEYLEGELDILE